MKLGDILVAATPIIVPLGVLLLAAAKGREEEEEEKAGGELSEFTVTIE